MNDNSTHVIVIPNTTTSTQGGSGGTATTADPLLARKAQFVIPPEVEQKYPDLIPLVLATESMSDGERQYWFQLVPIMSEEQIKKFRDILINEKEQLKKLDMQYEEQLNKLNSVHEIEWKEFESREKRRKIEEEESKAEAQDAKAEVDLLSQLDDI